MSYVVTIKVDVDNEAHSKLRELKERGDTFNDVIRRLLELPPVGTE